MSTTGASEDVSNVAADGTNQRSDEGLPRSFDVLIIGAGLTESILSAAVSRNGHSVLHLDPREYYGGSWATFSFDQWSSGTFMETPKEANEVKVLLKDQEGKSIWKSNVRLFEQVWYNNSEEMKKEIMEQKRRFNIDLMPKLVAAREDIIQLLITSNVSRYLEFLRVARLLTNLPPPNEDTIESIPLSRADIFTSKSLSLVEKRSLVKLIEAVLQTSKAEPDESSEKTTDDADLEQETFENLVKKVKVPEKLKHMVRSSVTTLEDGYSPDGEKFNQEFCSRCRLFLSSIGRYGNQTPFLWTLYGISEICQAFCRLSAVYGGIFILKRHLSAITTSDDGFIVETGNDEIKVKHVILGPDIQSDIVGKSRNKKEQSFITVGRAVLITTGGNLKAPEENSKTKGDGVYMYRLSGMEVIEMNNNSQAVPKNFRLLHVSFPILTTDFDNSHCRNTIEKNLGPFLEFQNSKEQSTKTEESETPTSGTSVTSSVPEKAYTSKPQVIYGSYFVLQYNCDSLFSELFRSDSEKHSNGLIMECGIGSTELSSYVSKAKEIFSSMYPDEEFLPRAPDCEEPESMNGDYEDYTPELPADNSDSNSAADQEDVSNSPGGN